MTLFIVQLYFSFQSVIRFALYPVTFIMSWGLLLQIVGFSVVAILFALMRQAHAWDLDRPIPSMLTAVESNLRIPLPFLSLGIAPILLSLLLSFLMSQPLPSFASFTIVSMICYLLANGFVILLIFISQLVFYAAALVHIFIKTR